MLQNTLCKIIYNILPDYLFLLLHVGVSFLLVASFAAVFAAFPIISTHAPARGATRMQIYRFSVSEYFNPRSRKESDQQFQEHPGHGCLCSIPLQQSKKKEPRINYLELITSALGSTLITISFLHFLQYAGKFEIFVFGNTLRKCGLPHFGHLHHLELIYYQLSVGWRVSQCYYKTNLCLFQ